MSKDSKFGTFGGVFTPSLLTILGVIMYLRLPIVVGQAGLYTALGIIVVAHAISIATGLSISSIATDKRVGAGGPYYIVSRSLGLPIGGTLGLALFIGLSFSISLYVIGFSESALAILGVEASANAIRVCGTATIVALTILTFISTALAIKTQYLILTTIALSLGSILLGGSPSTGEHVLTSAPAAPSIALLFGVFFPAVTGFTAGVNMSGDLKNPRRSLPRGTLAAIGVGLVVYIGLALHLALRVSRDALVNDPAVLQHTALVGSLVVAGIWGATLSSALGSILGAPRILQALATDHIAPRWFARGYGPTREPRNALLLAFAIGEAGILIAELDDIARIVSMVFLTTYGFLNLSCALESWASPDFNPSFRIPKWVSLIGAVISLLVMIQLDLFAMLGASALMALLFLALKRRQLNLDAGDTWEGVWSSLVRSALYRLSHSVHQQRNWRPNVLLARTESDVDAPIRLLGEQLTEGAGVLSDIVWSRDTHGSSQRVGSVAAPRLGVFERRVSGTLFDQDILQLARFHGFASIEPNTLLLPLSAWPSDTAAFEHLAAGIVAQDYNLLVYHAGDQEAPTPRMRLDVYWHEGAGSFPLSLQLARHLMRAHARHGWALRFLLLCDDTSQHDNLRATVQRQLRGARTEGSVRVLRAGSDDEIVARVVAESSDAGLTLIGLPHDDERWHGSLDQAAAQLLPRLPAALFIHASSRFSEVVSVGREASVSFMPPAAGDGTAPALAPVQLPLPPALAEWAAEQADGWREQLSGLYERGLQRLYAVHIQLIRDVRAVLERHLTATEKALESANLRRRRNLLNRTQSSILLDCRQLLEAFASESLEQQRTLVETALDAAVSDGEAQAKGERIVRVERTREEFQRQSTDSPWLRRFKRRRRFVAWLRRSPPSYTLDLAPFGRFYHHHALSHPLAAAVTRSAADTHRVLIRMGKLLHGARTTPALLARGLSDDELPEALARHRALLLGHLSELDQQAKDYSQRCEWRLLSDTRELTAALATDIDRLDATRLARRERRLKRTELAATRERLLELPARWLSHQRAIADRAILGVRISELHHRLASVASRERETLVQQVRSGTLAQCRALVADLDALDAPPQDIDATLKRLRARADFSPCFEPKGSIERIVRDLGELISELPERFATLDDDALEQLENGAADELGEAELPLRRVFQLIIDSDFLAGLQRAMDPIGPAELKTLGVAQETVRLVAHHLGEFEAADSAARQLVGPQVVEVAAKARERLSLEVDQLAALLAQLDSGVDDLLQRTVERSNAFELTATAAELDHSAARATGLRAVSGLRAWLHRMSLRGRDLGVALWYRRSAGVVLARRWQAHSAREFTQIDDLLELVDAASPRLEVEQALPFYYKQLFVGQSSINDSFWVGRERQLTRARRAIGAHRRGTTGALVVTGPRGSGKSALCQRVLGEHGQRPMRVHAPSGGTASLDTFIEALQKAVGATEPPSRLFAGLPDHSALVIDDLELWWERRPGGLEVIDFLLELIREHSTRCLFLISVGSTSYRFLDALRPVGDHALAVLECEPLTARELQQVVNLRHRSSGLRFSLRGRDEDQLSPWAQARLFSSHFDYCRGYVGPALRAWVSHIERFSKNRIHLRTPHNVQWHALEHLRPDWSALLTELVLHKQATLTRLCRVSRCELAVLQPLVETLVRGRLVLEVRPAVFELNPHLEQPLEDSLARQGRLP